jgi:hypothetical protein
MITRTFVVAIAVAACGDNQQPPLPDPTPTRTITGTAALVIVDEADRQTRSPIGLHDTLITAQFPTADGWDIREGLSNADGTFVIDDAPEGDYWLEVRDVPTGQRQLLWTDATVLAFEEHAFGRGDARAAGTGTTLTFGTMTGLAPVEAGDSLQLTSGSLGLVANVFGALEPGKTTTLQTTRGWAGQPLISAAAHDTVQLTQLRSAIDPATGAAFVSPIRSVTFDSIEQLDRADTRIAGAFTPPPDLTYELRWNRSEFAAAATDGNPGAGPVAGQQFTLRAEPGGTAFGGSPFAALVLSIDQSLFTGATDLAHTFAIKNPYPASWLFADYQMAFPIVLAVPDVPGATLEASSLIQVTATDLPDAQHPVVPVVTPPRAPQIEGADLFAEHAGVGTSPALSWTAPAHGAPTAYVISILRWDIQFGFADLADAGTLIVPGDVTSVRIPARMLEVGEHYVIRIAAITHAGGDIRTHSLYTVGLPFAYADTVGNTISP